MCEIKKDYASMAKTIVVAVAALAGLAILGTMIFHSLSELSSAWPTLKP